MVCFGGSNTFYACRIHILSVVKEPDQALVAKKDGYCYGVFRGTTLTLDDWSQNLVLQSAEICGSDRSSNVATGSEEPTVCCTVRAGFYDAYHTNYYQGMPTFYVWFGLETDACRIIGVRTNIIHMDYRCPFDRF